MIHIFYNDLIAFTKFKHALINGSTPIDSLGHNIAVMVLNNRGVHCIQQWNASKYGMVLQESNTPYMTKSFRDEEKMPLLINRNLNLQIRERYWSTSYV